MITFEQWAQENWMYISNPTDALVIWKAAQAASIADTAGAKPVAEVVNKYGDPDAFAERDLIVNEEILKALPFGTQLFAAPPAPSAADAAEWKYCPECGCEEHEPSGYSNGHFCSSCGQEWFPDVDYTCVVTKHLAEWHASSSVADATGASDCPLSDEWIEMYALRHIAPHASGFKKAFGLDVPYQQTEQFRRVKAYTQSVCAAIAKESGK